MAFGHPIVDAIVANVLGESYEGVTGTRCIPAGDDLASCSGWLFTYQFTISGVRPTEHLEPVFVSDQGEVDLELGHRIVTRGYQFDSSETEIHMSAIPVNLDSIVPIANNFAQTKIDELKGQAESHAAGRIDTEVSSSHEVVRI